MDAGVKPGAARLWAGRALSGLVVLFLALDGGMKLAQAAPVMEATGKLGFPAEVVFPLGVTLLLCTAVYAVPPTAVFGAILLTGYLGGAVLAHVRAGDPPFPISFPVILGALTWGGLALRQPGLLCLIFARSAPATPPGVLRLWAGRVLSGLIVMFFVGIGAMGLAKPPDPAAAEHMGFNPDVMPVISGLMIACGIVYAVPPTAMFGAILLAGYLGGACATHVRVGDPPFNIAFPVIFGVLAWLGLALRDPRLFPLVFARR